MSGIQKNIRSVRAARTRGARYEVVSDLPGKPLVIRDVGPWDRYLSVTNDAENVVDELVRAGLLPEGRPLYYYDSDGRLDAIQIEDGAFVGFAPVPKGYTP